MHYFYFFKISKSWQLRNDEIKIYVTKGIKNPEVTFILMAFVKENLNPKSLLKLTKLRR